MKRILIVAMLTIMVFAIPVAGQLYDKQLESFINLQASLPNGYTIQGRTFSETLDVDYVIFTVSFDNDVDRRLSSAYLKINGESQQSLKLDSMWSRIFYRNNYASVTVEVFLTGCFDEGSDETRTVIASGTVRFSIPFSVVLFVTLLIFGMSICIYKKRGKSSKPIQSLPTDVKEIQ